LDLNLQGKVALVIASSQGLGKVVAASSCRNPKRVGNLVYTSGAGPKVGRRKGSQAR
jgi:hypothetical protein